MENLPDTVELNNIEQLYFDEYLGVVNHSVDTINYTPTELPKYLIQTPDDLTILALDYILSDPVKIFIVLSSVYHVGFFATLGMFTFAAASENFKVSEYMKIQPKYAPTVDLAQDIVEKTVTVGLAFNGVVSAYNLTPKIHSVINTALLEALYIPLMVNNAKEMLDTTKELKTPFDAHHVIVPTIFGADPNGIKLNVVQDISKSAIKTVLRTYLYTSLSSLYLPEKFSGYIATIISSLISETAILGTKNYLNDASFFTNTSTPIITSAIKWGVFFPFLPNYSRKLHVFQAMEACMALTKFGMNHLMEPTNSTISSAS